MTTWKFTWSLHELESSLTIKEIMTIYHELIHEIFFYLNVKKYHSTKCLICNLNQMHMGTYTSLKAQKYKENHEHIL